MVKQKKSLQFDLGGFHHKKHHPFNYDYDPQKRFCFLGTQLNTWNQFT